MIGALLGGLWAKLLAGGAILLGLLGIAWRVLANAKNAGREQQRAEDANAGLAGHIKAQETVDAIRDDVRGLDDDARLQRLRDNERLARQRSP